MPGTFAEPVQETTRPPATFLQVKVSFTLTGAAAPGIVRLPSKVQVPVKASTVFLTSGGGGAGAGWAGAPAAAFAGTGGFSLAWGAALSAWAWTSDVAATRRSEERIRDLMVGASEWSRHHSRIVGRRRSRDPTPRPVTNAAVAVSCATG